MNQIITRLHQEEERAKVQGALDMFSKRYLLLSTNAALVRAGLWEAVGGSNRPKDIQKLIKAIYAQAVDVLEKAIGKFVDRKELVEKAIGKFVDRKELLEKAIGKFVDRKELVGKDIGKFVDRKELVEKAIGKFVDRKELVEKAIGKRLSTDLLKMHY